MFLKWIKVGDRVSKEFLKRLWAPLHTTQFQALQHDGNQITNFLDIVQAFVQHYEIFFASQPITTASQQALNDCCNVIPQ